MFYPRLLQIGNAEVAAKGMLTNMGSNALQSWSLYLKRHWDYLLAILIVIYGIVFLTMEGEMSSTFSFNKDIPVRQVSQDLIDYWCTHRVQEYAKRTAYVLSGVDIESLNLAIVNLMNIKRSDSAVRNYVVVVDEAMREHDTKRYIQLRKLASDNGIRIKSVVVAAKAEVEFHVFSLTEYDRVLYLSPLSLLLPKQKNISDTKSEIEPTYNHLDELFRIPSSVNFSAPIAYRSVDITPAEPQLLTLFQHIIEEGIEFEKETLLRLPPLVWQNQKKSDPIFNTKLMVIAPSKNFYNALKTKYVSLTSAPWYLWGLGVELDAVTSGKVINAVVLEKLKASSDPMSAIALPHQTYGLLSSEFRFSKHTAYTLEEDDDRDQYSDDWSAMSAISSSRVVHYSDFPIPAPWQPYNNREPYNSLLVYCFDSKFDPESFNELFPSNSKPMLTRDCDSVRIWEWLRVQWAARTVETGVSNTWLP